MNEDEGWEQLKKEWRSVAVSPGDGFGFGAAQARSRRKNLMIWSAFIADSVVAVYASVVSLSHRTVMGYTFAIIAWSIVIPLAACFVATAAKDQYQALDTASLLTGRLRRLTLATQMLEFSRILVGVEIIITAGFWIAIRFSQGRTFLAGSVCFAAFGTALYMWLHAAAKKIRHEQNALEAVAAALFDS